MGALLAPSTTNFFSPELCDPSQLFLFMLPQAAGHCYACFHYYLYIYQYIVGVLTTQQLCTLITIVAHIYIQQSPCPLHLTSPMTLTLTSNVQHPHPPSWSFVDLLTHYTPQVLTSTTTAHDFRIFNKYFSNYRNLTPCSSRTIFFMLVV